jgi:hypothetical protein
MQDAIDILKSFDIDVEVDIVSAIEHLKLFDFSNKTTVVLYWSGWRSTFTLEWSLLCLHYQ